MLVHPAFNTIFKPPVPQVRLVALLSDTADLTTYTFTSNIVPTLGTVRSDREAYYEGPQLRSRGRSIVVACIHSEDDAITYSTDAVSLGGVAGTEVTEQGATGSLNTALWYWASNELRNITNGNVSVTFSEPITSCAVSILVIDNLRSATIVAAQSSTPVGGNIDANPIAFLASAEKGSIGIFAMNCLGSGENAYFFNVAVGAQGRSGATQPQILYSTNNGEFSYAAAAIYFPCYAPDTQHGARANMSGATQTTGSFALFS